MRIFLSDFDGTLVYQDMLDVVCEITGHREESEQLNREVVSGKKVGLENLIKRINFLKGVSKQQIFEKLNKNNYLADGAKELFCWLKAHDFITVLHTGNIQYVAEYYQALLQIDYVICTKPETENNCIVGVSEKNFNDPDFKLNGCTKIIDSAQINQNDIFAIGDSFVDRKIFQIAGHSIAINAKGGIEKFADYEVKGNNLIEVIKYLEKIIN